VTDHLTSFFPAGRDRGVTVVVEGFFAFVWFGWGQAAPPIPVWICAGVGVHFFPLASTLANRSLRLLGVLLIAVAAAALATGLASATAPSTVTGAGAGLCLLAFGLATLITARGELAGKLPSRTAVKPGIGHRHQRSRRPEPIDRFRIGTLVIKAPGDGFRPCRIRYGGRHGNLDECLRASH
jgi:hypothetical protein